MIFTFLIEGNVAAQPELRYLENGTPVTQLRLMHNGRYRNGRGEWVDGKTVALDLTCWRDLAERVADLNKGDTVIAEVSDDLRAEAFGSRASMRATARTVAVSMRWHPAASLREPRPTTEAHQSVPVTGGHTTATEPGDPWEPAATGPATSTRKATASKAKSEPVPA